MKRIIHGVLGCLIAFGAFAFLSPSLSFAQMTRREVRYQWKRAGKAYKQKKYELASRLLFDIIENGAVIPQYQRYSRYLLARSLFRQKLYLVSLRYAIQLLQNTKPNKIDRPFIGTLTGLLRIAATIGDETLVIKMLRLVKPLLKKIPPSARKDPITYLLPVPPRIKKNPRKLKKWLKKRNKLKNPLYYFLGRLYFLKRAPGFPMAHLLLSKISKDAINNYYAKGLYLRGVMFAFFKKNLEAIKMFRQITKLTPLNPQLAREFYRIKEFAQYGIARAYYAMGVGTKNDTMARKLLIRSLKEYANIKKKRGVIQPEVLFETAYVHFMMGQYHFALGKLLALQSPYYKMGFFPELQILRSLIYYKNCKYQDTLASVKHFQKIYTPLKKQLKELISRRKKKKWLIQYYEYFLKQEAFIKEGKKTELPPSLIALMSADKAIRNYKTLLKSLAKELAIIRSKGRRWKESNLGRALLEVALNFRTTLKKFAGNTIWASMKRNLKEVSNLLGQAMIIQIETLEAQKTELMHYAEGGGIEQDEYRYTIVTEQSHIYWPYQGEYWRDEIGNYRQFIQGECKR